MLNSVRIVGNPHLGISSGLPVLHSVRQVRGRLPTQFTREHTPTHNYYVELLDQRKTRRARIVFQRLAPPTSVSMSNGIRSP